MTSIFTHRKPTASQSSHAMLQKLRETLEQLEAEPGDQPQIVNLKRILSARIQELEKRTAG